VYIFECIDRRPARQKATIGTGGLTARTTKALRESGAALRACTRRDATRVEVAKGVERTVVIAKAIANELEIILVTLKFVTVSELRGLGVLQYSSDFAFSSGSSVWSCIYGNQSCCASGWPAALDQG
jgi:hypothetical protein